VNSGIRRHELHHNPNWVYFWMTKHFRVIAVTEDDEESDNCPCCDREGIRNTANYASLQQHYYAKNHPILRRKDDGYYSKTLEEPETEHHLPVTDVRIVGKLGVLLMDPANTRRTTKNVGKLPGG